MGASPEEVEEDDDTGANLISNSGTLNAVVGFSSNPNERFHAGKQTKVGL